MDKYEREGLTLGSRGELADAAYGLKFWKDKVHAWMEVAKDNYKNSKEELEKVLKGYKMAEDIVDAKATSILRACKMRACKDNVVFAAYWIRDIIIDLRDKIKEIADPDIRLNFETIAKEFVSSFSGNLDRAKYYGYAGGIVTLYEKADNR